VLEVSERLARIFYFVFYAAILFVAPTQQHQAQAGDACPGPLTVIYLCGSLNLSIDVSTDKNGDSNFTVNTASANIAYQAPVILVAAQQGNRIWSDPRDWDGTSYQIINGAKIAYIFSDLLIHPFKAIFKIPENINTLTNLGPTEQIFSLSNIYSLATGEDLGSKNIDLGINLRFSANIPDMSYMTMTQSGVTLETLKIDKGGTLSTLFSGGYTIRGDLTNEGTLLTADAMIKGSFVNRVLSSIRKGLSIYQLQSLHLNVFVP
jgi:hypothetical protein